MALLVLAHKTQTNENADLFSTTNSSARPTEAQARIIAYKALLHIQSGHVAYKALNNTEPTEAQARIVLATQLFGEGEGRGLDVLGT